MRDSHALLLTVVFYASFTGAACLKYLGCYAEVEGRLFRDVQELNHTDLTIEKCLKICTSKGFRYAGLQYKIECFCSNNAPNSELKDEEECHSKCGGKDYQFCGGVIRLSVYDTKETPPYKYLGCYKEISIHNRLMTGYQENRDRDMTIARCLQICKENLFRFAGLQVGAECFCSNGKPTFGRIAPDSECSTKCTGSKELCGGTNRLSVYDTEEPFNVKYLGCYRERTLEDRLMKGMMQPFDDLTIAKCQGICESHDFRYFALQWSVECFCSNSLPPPSYSTLEADCDYKCSGNDQEICGGSSRLSVYDTRAFGGHNYRGCFKDVSFENRTMKGSRKDYPHSLRTDLCVEYCKQNGYFKTAGTQYGGECYCSWGPPSYQLMTLEEDCSHRCTGDANEKCGGNYRLSVYDIGETSSTVEHLYVGCFSKTSSSINDSHLLSHTLTADYCVGHCFIRGYLYAGLHDGRNCYCGDSYFTPNKYPNNECNVPCVGDPKTMCGGKFRMGVYRTLVSDESEKGRDKGCYVDDAEQALRDGPRHAEKIEMYESNSPKRCMNLCKVKDYPYSGVESGHFCYCGHALPSQDKKISPNQCKLPCPGDKDEYCGGLNKILVYATAGAVESVISPHVPQLSTAACSNSLTTVKGEEVCKGKVIFRDAFSADYDRRSWIREVYIPSEPEENFVYYSYDKENLQVVNGILQIIPTLVDDYEVRHGHLDLKRCTKSDREFCVKDAWTYRILPPIKSGQLTTKESFSFKYGKVLVRARLPLGDWLIPEIWLLPKENYYGPSLSSGKMVIAMARGNKVLKKDGEEIGNPLLSSGFEMGPNNEVYSVFINKTRSEGWYKRFHNFTLIWQPDSLKFQVDDEPEEVILTSKQPLRSKYPFSEETREAWSTGTNFAPFDREFYLRIGLSAGGRRMFPDDSETGVENHKKPWSNTAVKAMATFFLDKEKWFSTWNERFSTLEIDEVKVTAL